MRPGVVLQQPTESAPWDLSRNGWRNGYQRSNGSGIGRSVEAARRARRPSHPPTYLSLKIETGLELHRSRGRSCDAGVNYSRVIRQGEILVIKEIEHLRLDPQLETLGDIGVLVE